MIQRLDAASARRLSAGQVITGVPSVLKELVENSLDAGARTVTVRLEDFGLERIVVDDDGGGIALGGVLTSEGTVREDACPPLLACRATTKHPRGEEAAPAAQARDLLGFRGEALHCLANLSEVAVHTMTAASHPTTLCITYDVKAHRTGVRATRERSAPGTTVVVEKLFRALPVRHREASKSKKKQLLAATLLMKQYALSHPHVRLLVTHCLSPQSAPTTLVSLTGTNDTQRALAEAYGGRHLADMSRVEWEFSFGTLTGFVSKIDAGRLSPDMQVLALDGRLVDLPMISRGISDAYAECQPNAAQRVHPVFFLHLTCDRSVPYDVNLAPNKRKVLFTEESEHTEEVRARALATFRASTDGIVVDRHIRIEQTRRADWKASQDSKLTRTPVSATALTQFTYRRTDPPLTPSSAEDPEATEPVEMSKMRSSLYYTQTEAGSGSTAGTGVGSADDDDASGGSSSPTPSLCSPVAGGPGGEEAALTRACKRARPLDSPDDAAQTAVADGSTSPVFLTDEANQPRPAGPRTGMRFPSLTALSLQALLHPSAEATPTPPGVREKKRQQFGSLAEQTEKQLAMHLDKSSFKEMRIHGQFNHGFILASLGDDVFVVDQHAADEKFNYEALVGQYAARPQPLLTAVPVSMDPHDVDLAVLHSEELRQHGFTVRPGEDANKLLVSSVPVLQYEVVGPHDVVELVQQLALYGAITKPLRSVWHSMATKACRSSIMIGTALSEKTMRSVVSRLGELEQPWNCPHGRPTLRHVACVSSLMAALKQAPAD
ncbi:mismatch repair protein [Trypanosoma conorhini]|uniref:Mismatch repair protein n=1 Tax=Trypanosoma conorhini TaxID=83891 RepID=A0A3R7ND41_9TRYP|nr:mismatch repair protein [Trypanosoma conorhini]RNF00896.1 mismatch repair protein [Trypanosoma conorhini]